MRRAGYRIHEVPIAYDARGILEGKKIQARDGFVALWWLFKVRFTRRAPGVDPAARATPEEQGG